MDQRGPMEVRMRIQDRYFCFSAALFVAALTMFYMLWVTPYNNEEGTVFWAFFGAMAICAFVYNAYKAIIWSSRARRFKNSFGVNSPDNPGNRMDWKQSKALQPIVDKKLDALALSLTEVIGAEKVILDNEPGTLEEAMIRVKEIVEMARIVAIEKKYFWKIHNLAWEWGFEVWGSHKDYVSALDRAGKEKIKKWF